MKVWQCGVIMIDLCYYLCIISTFTCVTSQTHVTSKRGPSFTQAVMIVHGNVFVGEREMGRTVLPGRLEMSLITEPDTHFLLISPDLNVYVFVLRL